MFSSELVLRCAGLLDRLRVSKGNSVVVKVILQALGSNYCTRRLLTVSGNYSSNLLSVCT